MDPKKDPKNQLKRKRVNYNIFNIKKDLEDDMVKEFNKVRTNPLEYVPKVEELIQYIQPGAGPKNNPMYIQEKIPKTVLLRGEPAFRDLIETLSSKEPLGVLELRKDLALAVPEESSQWPKRDVFSNLMHQKMEELKDVYKNFSFHYDIGTCDAHISTVLQIVDDNPGFNGLRRGNILNPEYKYVGIGHAKEKTKYCFYFLFAN